MPMRRAEDGMRIGKAFREPRSGRRPPRLPLHHATALQHWRPEACEDSDVRRRGHTWPRRSARTMISSLGFRMVRSDGRIHALGRFHIGGVAYCVWALPPKAGGTAHRYTSPTLLIPSPFWLSSTPPLDNAQNGCATRVTIVTDKLDFRVLNPHATIVW